MDHLWLLTEERPKPSVVLQIIKMYCKDFDDRITLHNEIKILPHIKDGIFQFVYEVEGLKVSKADTIFIKTVSGNSSFFLCNASQNRIKFDSMLGLKELRSLPNGVLN